jgi:hypothetical protein
VVLVSGLARGVGTSLSVCLSFSALFVLLIIDVYDNSRKVVEVSWFGLDVYYGIFDIRF